MKKQEIMNIINETIVRLNNNAIKLLDEKRPNDAQRYSDYATGARMLRDNIEYEYSKKEKNKIVDYDEYSDSY